MPSPAQFVEMTKHIMSVAQRSQKVLALFMEQNKAVSSRLGGDDPMHLSEAFSTFIRETLGRPEAIVEQNIAFWQDYVRLLQNTVKQLAGEQVEPVIAPDRGDKRFKDEDWQKQWVFDFIKQSYLLVSRWVETFLQNGEKVVDPHMAHKVRFYTNQIVDAMAPSNFVMTNPEILRLTAETHGENLIKGLEHLLEDIEHGKGQLMIKQSDSSAFHYGENIASSKGKVVFQNDLIQLIQFTPTTQKVHKTPFLIIPPWINKYYILDLKPESSFIHYLVENGHTVFCVSWANPTDKLGALGFDDYMMQGPVEALRQVGKITGEKEVNCLGYCIGGTLVACMTGWMAGLGDKKPADLPAVKSVTYLVALVDFSYPGDLGVFIDEDQVAMIEKLMAGRNYLPASFLSTTFSMLRANDLIWSYVVNNYLRGNDPVPFDLLTWNSDSTNLPAKMESYYLRNMYMRNALIQPNALSMKGVPIDLSKVTVPAFIIGAKEDHITLWRGVYSGTQVYSGPATFCLAGSGHIAGVVNPPAKNKYQYWTNDTYPKNPDEWYKGATEHKGSWWPHWVNDWLSQYAGPQEIAASDRDPASNPNAIEDAPGSFVKVRMT